MECSKDERAAGKTYIRPRKYRAIVKGPIFEGGARKEGGSVSKVGKGSEDKRVGGG